MADKDYLNLSDEEIMNMPVPEAEPAPAPEADPEPTPPAPVETPVKDPDPAPEPAPEDGDEPAEGGDQPTERKGESSDAGAEKKKEKQDTPPKQDEAPDAIDYKAEYERLLTPFKANGRDMAVSNVEEALTLMKMGANYNKKMAALKPNLKLLKMLENNGLLDESKLGFLIDLDKKRPEAINKLMQDSGMDPMDLDAEKATSYAPTKYTVDDREVELDSVLDEIQETPSYNRTLNIVGTQWDGVSKQAVADNPQVLRVINDHVQLGIYDVIAAEVDKHRALGRLQGLSDIEAYRQVGDHLHTQGKFNHLRNDPPQSDATPTTPVVVAPNPKGDEDKLREKKRAASSTRPASAPTAKTEYNPLSLSDDDFEKLVDPKFL